MSRNSGLAIALALGISGCGDEGPSSSTPVDASTSVAAVVGEGSTALRANQFVLLSLRTTTSGLLEAIVAWTFTSNTLWVYIARSCTVQQFSTPDCPFGASCPCEFSPGPRSVSRSREECRLRLPPGRTRSSSRTSGQAMIPFPISYCSGRARH